MIAGGCGERLKQRQVEGHQSTLTAAIGQGSTRKTRTLRRSRRPPTAVSRLAIIKPGHGAVGCLLERHDPQTSPECQQHRGSLKAASVLCLFVRAVCIKCRFTATGASHRHEHVERLARRSKSRQPLWPGASPTGATRFCGSSRSPRPRPFGVRAIDRIRISSRNSGRNFSQYFRRPSGKIPAIAHELGLAQPSLTVDNTKSSA